MIIAQLSDFHVVAPGELLLGRVDTYAALERAVQAVMALPQPPDVILATGDLVNDGTAEQYAAVRRALRPLPMRIYPMVGNHDCRDPFRTAFADVGIDFEPAPFIQYTVALADIRLVVLDTVTEGSQEPSFCDVRASWLRSALSDSNLPTVIATHHPPFPPGIVGVDPIDSDWAFRLAEEIARAPHVVRVISGHAHRTMHTQWAGVTASVAPSTGVQVFPNLTGEGPLLISDEPGGLQLHRWRDGALLTYTISAERFTSTFPPTPA